MDNEHIHASSAVWKDKAVLLTGPAGSGKSTLLLRLMDAGFAFLGDDRLIIERRGNGVWVRPEESLRGLMEMPGYGVVRLPMETPVVETAEVALVVNCEGLMPGRVPEPKTAEYLGVKLSYIGIPKEDEAAVAKIRLLLQGAETLETLR